MRAYRISGALDRWWRWICLSVGLRNKRKDAHGSVQDRFDTFTKRARIALSLAQEEAQRLRHQFISTEHLFLGLVREREGVAGTVLASCGVDLENARTSVEHRLGRGSHIVFGEIRLTPAARKAIELAIDEAHRLNHTSIGTGHLLLGWLHEEEDSGSGVLKGVGLNVQEVQAATLQALNAQSE